MFTERELKIIVMLVSNAIEDATVTLQVVREQSGISDAEAYAYLHELRMLERQVTTAIETGDWAPNASVDSDPHEGAEGQYEPTEEDLDEFDAHLADEFEHEEGLLD